MTVKGNEILACLRDLAQSADFAADIERLKGIDLNPFEPAPTGEVAGFDRWREANRILFSMVDRVITVVERVAVGIGGVSTGDKVDAVAAWLDEVVELPFWAEPFDKKVFAVLISQSVTWSNEKLGPGWAWPTEPAPGS